MIDRLAKKTAEAWIQHMRDQLAAETAKKREAWLQQMSECRREQLAAETVEERNLLLD